MIVFREKHARKPVSSRHSYNILRQEQRECAVLSGEAAMSPIVPGFPTPTDPAYYNSCGPAPTSLRSFPPPPPPASLPPLLPNINPAAAGSGCKGDGGGGVVACHRQRKLTGGRYPSILTLRAFQAKLRGLCVSVEPSPVRPHSGNTDWSPNSFRHLIVQVMLRVGPCSAGLGN